MTYHLPRIMLWAQNKTVAHFTTYDVRQISSPVLAEFVNLHQYIILGTDKLFNSLQTSSYLLNGLIVFEISKAVSVKKNNQVLAVLLYLSMPIAFAEAFTTQVDNFAAIWPLLYVYYSINLYKKKELSFKDDVFNLVLMGLCTGFAYESKPSGCLIILVFSLFLFADKIIQKKSISLLFEYTLVVVIVAFIIVAPEITRNILTFGSFSAGMVGERQLIGTLKINYIIVNFVKNLAFQLGVPFVQLFSSALYFAVYLFSKVLNVNLNDPAISEDGRQYMVPTGDVLGHDKAVNVLIMWVFVIQIVIIIFRFLKKKEVKFDYFNRCSVISFLFFLCILRWERFETRYLIPYLSLICIFISKGIELLFNGTQIEKVVRKIIIVLCIINMSYLSCYHINKCISEANEKSYSYFVNNPSLKVRYQKISEYINKNNYKTAAIFSNDNNWSYPLWTLCENLNQIENICIDDNGSEKYEKKEYIPEVVVWLENNENSTMMYHGEEYKKVYQIDDFNLYECIN